MAVRTIVLDGELWTVWQVVPETPPSVNHALLRSELRAGWLCMESDRGEKRRVVPTPTGWEGWEEGQLGMAVKAAEVVRPVRVVPPPLAE